MTRHVWLHIVCEGKLAYYSLKCSCILRIGTMMIRKKRMGEKICKSSGCRIHRLARLGRGLTPPRWEDAKHQHIQRLRCDVPSIAWFCTIDLAEIGVRVHSTEGHCNVFRIIGFGPWHQVLRHYETHSKPVRIWWHVVNKGSQMFTTFYWVLTT